MASSYISATLRRLVIERAKNRCEYCGLSQQGQEATFHVDHIMPLIEGGETIPENLALACVSCSLRKAARVSGLDPGTKDPCRLFHPRQDSWLEHFRWEGVRVLGVTAVGRTTIDALRMNRELILAIRDVETVLGRHPPEPG